MFLKFIMPYNVIVVRYSSVNRINQMFMKNHGAVDYSYFFDYIKGLCFPSPYTRMDKENEYEDSLGVFDRTREKVLKYLYKNHDFKGDTEVSKIGKRLV